MASFRFLKLLLLVYTINISVTSSNDDVDGYYWKDYKGIIPEDAFIAIYDNDNRPLYIGQVHYDQQLIPARIDPYVQQVFYESGVAEHVPSDNQNVKIFCTRHPEQLQWVPSSDDSIKNVRGKIVAGYEARTTIYFGRKYWDGGYQVGKILTESHRYLHTTVNGKVQHHPQFDVLTYNPNIKKVYHSTTISSPIKPNVCVKKEILINYY